MPAIDPTLDEEVLDLEPTMTFDVRGGPARGGVSLPDGTHESTSGGMKSPHRSRIAAIAFLLAFMYLALAVWNLGDWAATLPGVWWLMASRFVFSAVILGLIVSPVGRSTVRARVLEGTLIIGICLLLVATQYAVNLAYFRAGNLSGAVAFFKNGVIQAIILMILYGTFVPNRPKVVAWSVLGIALAPLLAGVLLTEQPEIAVALAQFQGAEHPGTNIVFLLIAAGIAIFSSLVLNGLHAQLHEARKFGQYRLLNRLGAGGMGEVFLAEHALLKRPCALKLIKADAMNDATALARFALEVQSSARLEHPNTISIYDYGQTDDGTFYYVMEYLQGFSLADLVEQIGALTPGRVVYLMHQVCSGLAEAHQIGLIHRDLKPANIFVARHGGETDVAKVLDFGLVKVAPEPGTVALTMEMTVNGSPLYMSPEQAAADSSIDARADIYALGAVMYFALTSRPPFNGDSPLAVMMAHARDPVVPPSLLEPRIPKDLETIVLRCLAKTPADRYPNVRSLREALEECESASDWGPSRADAWWAASAGLLEDAQSVESGVEGINGTITHS